MLEFVSSEVGLSGVVLLEAVLPGVISSGIPLTSAVALDVMSSAEESDGGAKELAEKPSRRRFSFSAAPGGETPDYQTEVLRHSLYAIFNHSPKASRIPGIPSHDSENDNPVAMPCPVV